MINAYFTVLKFPCKSKGKFCLLGVMRGAPMLVEPKQSLLTLLYFKDVMALRKSFISFNLTCFMFFL